MCHNGTNTKTKEDTMYTFKINDDIGEITQGPPRESDGLPQWVEWRGELFDTPEYECFEFWTFDSVCETLEGGTIEPDGWDYNGCPSWLLAIGLI